MVENIINKSFDIRDPPSNVIGDKVQSRDEAKGKIEAEVIISCRSCDCLKKLVFWYDLYGMIWSVGII